MVLSTSQKGLAQSQALGQLYLPLLLSLFQGGVGGIPHRITTLDLGLFFFSEMLLTGGSFQSPLSSLDLP